MSVKFVSTAFAIVVACASLSAQTGPLTRLDGSQISSQQIDTTVEQLMRTARVTGLGIAVLNCTRIVYLKVYGLRDT